jgi:hypothetical protein
LNTFNSSDEEAAMSIRSYYRWAMAMPVVLPLLATGVLMVSPRDGDLGIILFYLFGSLVIGGGPYLLFAAGFLLWTRGRSDGEIRRVVLLSPLVFTGVMTVCLALFVAVDSGSANGDFLGASTAFGVVFGYAYVLLAEIGRLMLRPSPTPVAAGIAAA